jgi:hypothetical protein
MQLYLARHKSGRWVVVRAENARKPPFIDIRGPFEPTEARWLAAQTNYELGYRYRLERPGQRRYHR